MPRSAFRSAELGVLEVAEAAVLADLTVGMCLLGWLLPLGSVLVAAAVAPMAALVRGTACGSWWPAASGPRDQPAARGAELGRQRRSVRGARLIVGAAERRGWSRARTLTVAACTIWPIGAGLAVAGLFVFASLRELMLQQAVIGWRGTAVLLRQLGLDGSRTRATCWCTGSSSTGGWRCRSPSSSPWKVRSSSLS